MKSSVLACFLAVCFALAPSAHARVEAGPIARLDDGRSLKLNGSALQEVLFFKLYRLDLYLERPTQSAAEVIDSNQAKQLRLEVLRSLPRSKVAKALQEGFARSVSQAELASLAPRVEQMTSRLRDVRKNDEIVITYVPGKGTTIESDDAGRVVIPGKDFADALFAIWLGPNTDAPKVRAALLQP